MSDPAARSAEPGTGGDLHGRPTARELLDAVTAHVRDQLLPQLDGPLRHQARIAVHALEIVGRELALQPGQSAAHAERLAALGVTDDAELADAIRQGRLGLDDRQLRAALRADTRDRLLAANPRWLPPDER